MSNNDNAMTRFLFAILRQKNLKDIDWNKVAQDPILAQEITNGHAARMRYSRFRSAMLGLEPQRRNRTTNKNKVTKSTKKDPKGKKDEGVKSESTAEPANTAESSEPSSSKIKQETTTQNTFESRLTPGPVSAAPPVPAPQAIQPRLLTPCSDTDAFATSQGLAASPTTEMLNSPSSFDFAPDFAPPYFHGQNNWHHAMYPAFDAPHGFDGFDMACAHQHMHHHPGELFAPHPMAEPEGNQPHVKHENWDGQCP